MKKQGKNVLISTNKCSFLGGGKKFFTLSDNGSDMASRPVITS